MLGDEQATFTQQQGVTVGRRACHGIGRQQAGGAGTVFHHHLLAELRAQSRREQTRHRVHATAGRIADEQADRVRGVVLGQRGRSRRRQCDGAQQ